MSKIELLVVPDLYTSHRKLLERLERSSLLDLFLNQPNDLEPHFTVLAAGELSYRDFLHKIREEKLVPKPIDGWRYPVEQLLKSLPRLKRKSKALKIHCYVDSGYHRLLNEKALEVARLTLRSNITGKIGVEEWKTILVDKLDEKYEELERETDFISRRAGERAVCVSGYDGKGLEELLVQEGHEVTRKHVEKFYHPKPIEALEEKLVKDGGKTSEKEFENLVKEHFKYIKEYVLKNRTRDQAYWKWAFNNFSDVQERYSPEEIEVLANIALEEV